MTAVLHLQITSSSNSMKAPNNSMPVEKENTPRPGTKTGRWCRLQVMSPSKMVVQPRRWTTSLTIGVFITTISKANGLLSTQIFHQPKWLQEQAGYSQSSWDRQQEYGEQSGVYQKQTMMTYEHNHKLVVLVSHPNIQHQDTVQSYFQWRFGYLLGLILAVSQVMWCLCYNQSRTKEKVLYALKRLRPPKSQDSNPNCFRVMTICQATASVKVCK